MEEIKLQNIIFPEEKQSLYYHIDRGTLFVDGYFNLFDIAGRKKYTDIKDLILRIRADGYETVAIIHNETEIGRWELVEGEVSDIQLPYDRYVDGIFWFKLEKRNEDGDSAGTVAAINDAARIEASFWGRTEKRDIGICVGMCTYKREDYVRKNMKVVAGVIGSDEEVADHLSMYVVDNGQTLDETLTEFRVFRNVNAGGASGFTRAMIEALKVRNEKGFTHILLMDDDVEIMSDLFVRLYGLLCTLKDEYKDIRVGGELFRKDFPEILNARGEWSQNYLIESENHLVDLGERAGCVEVLGKNVDDERLYTGWWCACYSLDMIEKTALAMPLFIHEDDIGFEMEHRAYKIMFMNGISVWHNGFEFGNYGVNQYYHIRNKLITSSLYEQEINGTRAAKWVAKCMISLLISYRYKEIELIRRAVTDFCKGPEWLYEVDADRLNSGIRSIFSKYGMKEDDLSQVPAEVCDLIKAYRDGFDISRLKAYSSENRTAGHMKNKITLNGWILPADKKFVEMTLIDNPFKAYRAKNVILFDPQSEKSVILRKDYRKFVKSLLDIVKTVIRVKKNYDEVAGRYRTRKKDITTVESWEKYLGI